MKTYLILRFEYGHDSNKPEAIRETIERLNDKSSGSYTDFAEKHNCKVWEFTDHLGHANRNSFMKRLNYWSKKGWFNHIILVDEMDDSKNAAEWADFLNDMHEGQVEEDFLHGDLGRLLDYFYEDTYGLRPSEDKFRELFAKTGLPDRFYSVMMEIIDNNFSWPTQEELDEAEKQWASEEEE